MTPKPKELLAINLLLKALRKDFIGKHRCKVHEPMCYQCTAQMTEYYLLWLKDQYEETISPHNLTSENIDSVIRQFKKIEKIK